MARAYSFCGIAKSEREGEAHLPYKVPGDGTRSKRGRATAHDGATTAENATGPRGPRILEGTAGTELGGAELPPVPFAITEAGAYS